MRQIEYIVVPAYNEGPRLARTLGQLLHLGYKQIVVVDDGSSDETYEIAKSMSVKVIRHPINLGVGAATQTGITYALQDGADYIVTIDADGQHNPSDIEALLHKIKTTSNDLIIGSRFLKKDNQIPRSRRFYNWVGNYISYLAAGELVTDSQSGMKVMSRHFAESAELSCNGFEFCIEMIRNAKRNRCFIDEIPISVIYTKETMEKGQNFMSGMRMILRLIRLNILDS